jgi:SAM-dependent MidA family methyltransferase
MSSNSTPLQQIIIEAIAQSPQGYLSFAEYLNLVLYHPWYGYYSSKSDQIGARGDFFTSCSLGADFGELIAVQLQQMWEVLAYPHPFTVLEMGAGKGHLAWDILNHLQREYPHCFQAINYVINEISPQLRQQQQQLLTPKFPQVTWKNWQEIPDNSLIGCCFSNELVDAFPVHQLILSQGELKEIYVTFSDNQFKETYQPLSQPELAKYFQLCNLDFPSANYPDGYRTEVNLFALQWLETLASKLNTGYILTIDYGYDAEHYYHPQREQGTLQCYYQHQRHHNPYLYLGEQDITTHVNFTALERQGELLGLNNLGLTKQGIFLMALGLGDKLQKITNSTNNLQQIIQRRDALHQLINPAGLGNFTVLLQGKNLTQQLQQFLLQGWQF